MKPQLRATTGMLLSIAGTLSLSAVTYTWNPAASATFNEASPLFSDGANWGGTAPTVGSSLLFDVSNGVNAGGVSNLGGSGELRLNVNSSFTVATGQSITTAGTSTVVDYADLTVRDGGVLDVYGTVNLDTGSANIADRIITTADSKIRIHSGSTIDAQYILPFGATEFVINSASDTFSFATSFNAHFELGTGIGFDLSGLTESLDGVTFDLFEGTLPGIYDDNNTYVTGGAYDAVISQSGTGATQTLSVTFTSVPEPSSAFLLGVGGLAFLSRRKR